jgi:hypothetical protein
MSDKDKSTKTPADDKTAPADELRDLDVLDDKVDKVKGGAARLNRRKRI